MLSQVPYGACVFNKWSYTTRCHSMLAPNELKASAERALYMHDVNQAAQVFRERERAYKEDNDACNTSYIDQPVRTKY